MKKIILITFVISLLGCGAGSTPTVDEFLTQGWTFFEAGDYTSAYDQFTQAKAMDNQSPEVFAGLGWTQLKQNELALAAADFQEGLNFASADVFAGYAFVLNAQKNYALSNTEADSALSHDAAWQFAHIASLNSDDLHLLKAENYFAVGNFANCLTEIQVLSPGFTADATTFAGQTQIAAKIEALKING